MKFTTWAVGIAQVATLAQGKAIEATDKTLKGILDSGIPTMLDVYASWCGHCKKIAPVWDELADKFENAKDKVQVVKIDGDKHSKAAKKFNVQYFPTLKFVDAKGEEQDVETRELDELVEFVTKHTGAKPKREKKSPDHVVSLTDSNFDDKLKDTPALVAFTASWCGHCKTLKPVYRELADVYKRDNVVIGLVDCTGDDTSKLCEDIGGYPTIRYYSGKQEEKDKPEEYSSGRGLHNFLQFLNERTGLYRTPEGGLGRSAGRVSMLDDVAIKLADSGEKGLDRLKYLADFVGKEGELYAKYGEKVASKGIGYATKELARLQKLIDQANIAPQKLDQLTIKSNVLRSFVEKGDGKDDEKKGADNKEEL